MDHPIETIMRTTMESLTDMIDVNTVVGDSVATSDGTTIIPISKVSFGFVSGGGEYGDPAGNRTAQERLPFAGGAGAGVSVTPLGFLVVGDGCIRMLPACAGTTVDRIVELIPQLIKEVKDVVLPARKEIRCPESTQHQPSQMNTNAEF